MLIKSGIASYCKFSFLNLNLVGAYIVNTKFKMTILHLLPPSELKSHNMTKASTLIKQYFM